MTKQFGKSTTMYTRKQFGNSMTMYMMEQFPYSDEFCMNVSKFFYLQFEFLNKIYVKQNNNNTDTLKVQYSHLLTLCFKKKLTKYID